MAGGKNDRTLLMNGGKLGSRPKVSVHTDDSEAMIAKWQALLAAGQPGELEGRVRRFDGEYRWFLFRAAPYQDEQGKIVNWYGTSTDIDDRKLAEE
jgi:PAS domain S-box-containing protein